MERNQERRISYSAEGAAKGLSTSGRRNARAADTAQAREWENTAGK